MTKQRRKSHDHPDQCRLHVRDIPVAPCSAGTPPTGPALSIARRPTPVGVHILTKTVSDRPALTGRNDRSVLPLSSSGYSTRSSSGHHPGDVTGSQNACIFMRLRKTALIFRLRPHLAPRCSFTSKNHRYFTKFLAEGPL